ncbi:MAG: hypothetical protein MZU84_04375 [Sphingobacterium sp.]|nr:hypothetical protein [Sphingobacterium sp.]
MKAEGKDEPRERPLVGADDLAATAGWSCRDRAGPSDFKDRWIVAVDPESGKTRVIDALHDDAWIREAGGGPFGGGGHGLDARRPQPLVPVRARRVHAPLRRRRLAARRSAGAAHLGQVRGHLGRALARTRRSSTSSPPRSTRASGTCTRCRPGAGRARG